MLAERIIIKFNLERDDKVVYLDIRKFYAIFIAPVLERKLAGDTNFIVLLRFKRHVLLFTWKIE